MNYIYIIYSYPYIQLKSVIALELGQVQVHDYYLMDKMNGGTSYFWSKHDIFKRSTEECTCGAYKMPNCGRVIRRYQQSVIEGKVGIVVGSQSPWAEATLLGR